MTSIGMNLAPVNYWGTEYPFIDRMKSSGNWQVQGANVSGPVSVDANGYPTGLPAGAIDIYTMIGMDPTTDAIPDTYVLTYSGTADIKLGSSTIISSEPGKIVFKYNGTDTKMFLKIMSMSSSDPISDMHIVRQDQVDLFNSGEIFNPAFTSKIQNFDTLRYMNWGNTNNNTLTSWSQRTTEDSLSWAGNNTTASVPIEVMVKLANETKTNMWLDIPAQADDDYVRKTLEYVRDNLDPSLKVNLEYSNEVWNFSFQQGGYAQKMADQLWGNGSQVGRGNFIYYGYRSAQIAAISQDVFGASADGRLNNVISTQTAYHGIESLVFQGVAKAGLGDVSSLFDSYAITSYFSGPVGKSQHDLDTILQWARSGQAGVDAAIQEMLTGSVLDSNASIADVIQDFVYQSGVAAQNGLDLVSYEGGLDLNASLFPAAVQPEIMDFFARIKADPRMADITRALVNAFTNANGTLINIFQDVQVLNNLGNYGTLDSIYGNSPTYEALVQLANQAQAAGAVKTDQSSYAMPSGQNGVTYTGADSFSAQGNALSNEIIGGNGQNFLDGGAGNDLLVGGTANDWLNGGAGMDTMIGGAGNDVYVVDNLKDVVIELPNEGIDEVQTTLSTYVLNPNIENLTYLGTAAFTGTGNALNNVIRGGAGNDTLTGGGGADTLIGGAGNDTYIVEDAGDVVIEAANGGTDTVRTTLGSYTLTSGVENLVYTGQGDFFGRGNDLNNTITGGAGNDTLDGGLGSDRLIGGAGNDVYYTHGSGDVIVEAPDGGIDTVLTTATSLVLAANVENAQFIGQGKWTATGNAEDNLLIGGDGGNSLYGGAGDDTLVGGAGDDQLHGGSGRDVMTGGAGNDTYYVDDIGARVIEYAGEGKDTVISTVTYTLDANIEQLRLMGTNAIDGFGNNLDNWLVGNDADNLLRGFDGNDTISGGGGNDTIDGGAGDDNLSGGVGDDLILGGVGDDLILGGDGNDTLIGGPGIDKLQGQGGADLFLFRPGDLGTTRATTDIIYDFDSLSGDRIDLSAYGATLGLGQQTFIGGAAFSRKAGEVRAQLNAGYWDITGDLNGDGIADYSLTVSSKNAISGADFVLNVDRPNQPTAPVLSRHDAAVQAAGNGADAVLAALGASRLTYPGQVDGMLRGDDLNNTIIGGAGNDIIDGGLGADRMIGGLGDDIYYAERSTDTVIEAADGGIDTVFTTASSFVLATNVENGRFIGQDKWLGIGNAGDNILVGGDGGASLYGYDGDDTLIGGLGDDTLHAGTGHDVMFGGKGDDTYYVDDASQEVIEAADAGKDVVVSSVSYTIGANIEQIKLVGTNAIDATGNALDNWLTGNDAANHLYGMDGNDSINGGGGNDTLEGGAGNDLLNGGDGDDLLIGGDGDDNLLGGAGDDTLIGGAGIDKLQGQGGADLFVFRPGDLGTTRATTDIIYGFDTTSGSKIDLSAFDAVLGGDEKQTFIGDNAFSGKAGEVRARLYAGYLDVTGDLNGDGVADYSLTVNSKTNTISAMDFVL